MGIIAKAGARFQVEPLVLDAQARRDAPGQFVRLTDGMVHYEIAGPTGGQPIVLLHGFSVPYFIWDPTFAALAVADFRVLRYDLYGRGYSDRPDTVYDHDLYDRQLVELLAALDVALPVGLVGLSMGGPLAAVFTDRHPGQVRKLCLIDPAGFPQKRMALAGLITAPLLGELLMGLFAEKVIIAGLKNDMQDAQSTPDYAEKCRLQMRYRGFRRALLSTLRNGVLDDKSEVYRRLGKQGPPVLLIWGREDKIIPLAVSELARAAMPQANFHAIDEAGHIPHYEKPEVVHPLLIAFFRQDSTA